MMRILLCMALCMGAILPARGQGTAGDLVKYFKKWLGEDVAYIITADEKKVFQSLTTPEEKEHFIEQFWKRRDPDPRTPENEFKEEHYRRIAHSNERFRSGFDGWRTDRGRIYIVFGPPDELEKHPAGGPYERPAHEGGGRTTTYPFEVWRYRYLPGIGNGVEIEFVDASLSGDYRMALSPDEKDALLRVGNTGLTVGEEMGLETRLDRLRGRFASNRENPLLDFRRAQDTPFARFRQFVELQKPQEIKFRDLKGIVETNISYQQLAFNAGTHWFRVSEDLAIVPITVEIANRELTYKETEGRYAASVNVYGAVQSLTGGLVAEFDDTLTSRYDAQSFPFHKRETSAYQKILMLPGGLYKVTLACRDVHGSKVGTAVYRLEVPKKVGETSEIMFSSLIPSRQLQIIDRIPERLEQFILGDVKIIPKLDRRFYVGDTAYIYFHLYNVPLNSSTQQPLLSLKYHLSRDGKNVLEIEDPNGGDMFRFTENRVIIIRPFDLKNLLPGSYRLEIEAYCAATRGAGRTSMDFVLVSRPEAASAQDSVTARAPEN